MVMCSSTSMISVIPKPMISMDLQELSDAIVVTAWQFHRQGELKKKITFDNSRLQILTSPECDYHLKGMRWLTMKTIQPTNTTPSQAMYFPSITTTCRLGRTCRNSLVVCQLVKGRKIRKIRNTTATSQRWEEKTIFCSTLRHRETIAGNLPLSGMINPERKVKGTRMRSRKKSFTTLTPNVFVFRDFHNLFPNNYCYHSEDVVFFATEMI